MKTPKKSNDITAHKLMILLASMLFLIFALTVGAFIFAHKKLTSVADEVAQVTTQAVESRTKVQQLQQTEKELDKYTDEIDRAAKIVAESQSYQYQDQIINDITDYANRADINITSFSFSENSTGATTTPSPAPTAAPGGAGESIQSPTGTTGGSAPKSTSVVVNLDTEVPYNNLLRFMSLIERNLTKMQIANVTLSKASGENQNAVSSQSLNLEVYIR